MENVLKDTVAGKQLEDNDEDLHVISTWIWARCQTHKDLNAAKGSCAGMRRAWEELDEAPMPLANRDDVAILAAVVNGLADPSVAMHANAYTVGVAKN